MTCRPLVKQDLQRRCTVGRGCGAPLVFPASCRMAQLPVSLPAALQRLSFLEPLPVLELAQNTSHPSPQSPSSPGVLYCNACRKNFSSQNTWNAHLTSQRHLKSQKKPGLPPSPSKSPKALSRQEEAELIGRATAWQREAEEKAAAMPVKACNLLLRAGKAFLQATQLRDAGVCYETIIGTQKARTTDWSVEALLRDGKLEVLVHSAVHLGRLYFPFVRELSVEYAKAAVRYMFGASVDVDDNETIASLRALGVKLFDQLRAAAKTKPAEGDSSAQEALVNRAVTVLFEAADILSVSGPLHSVTAVCYFLLAAEARPGESRQRALRRAAQVYQDRGEVWYAIDCMLEMESDDAAEALYLCVLHDDRVRMQRALRKIRVDLVPFLRLVAEASLALSVLMLDEACLAHPSQDYDPRIAHLVKKVHARLL